MKYILLTFLLYIVDKLFTNSYVGYALIYGSIMLFGRPELLSWEWFTQILLIATGGVTLIRHGEKMERRER